MGTEIHEADIHAADIHANVALYALGLLDEAAHADFERHLERGCAPCQAELGILNTVTDEMAVAAAVPAPDRLRGRIAAKTARAPRVPGHVMHEGGLLIARSAEVAWQPFSPGIDYKLLSTDTLRENQTMLVRMEAGARYAAHRHADIEELFLLSGDLHVAGEIMHGGDYCRAEAGTEHGETHSDSGCLFLLIASQHNQLLEA